MACQRKSRTEVCGSLNGFYSFLRVRFQSHLRGQKQVGVCLMMRTSDPASQLMQLSQPEFVCSIDDDGIRAGYIYSRFDDRRAHQNVVTLVVKVRHDFFKFSFWHLAMGDANSCLWDQLL